MKKIVKALGVLSCVCSVVFGSAIYAYAETPYSSLYYDGENHSYSADKIYLSVNGEMLEDSELPIQPINIDGTRTLVPLREVFESLGGTVSFDGATNTVTVKDGNNTVVVVVDSNTGYINGEAVEMDTAPKYVSIDSNSPKKVMIPLRFVGEGLGYTVNYDAPTRTVTVNAPKNVTVDESNNGNNTTENPSSNNATKVEFSTGGNADLFTIYGENVSPEIKEVTVVNDSTLYIDVLKPNTISNVVKQSVKGLAVSSYEIYDLNYTTTRIEVVLSTNAINNVVKNGNLTKVYIKPVEDSASSETENVENVENNNNNNNTETIVDEFRVLSLETTPRMATLKINKSFADISANVDINNIVHTDNYLSYQYILTSPISLKNTIPTQNITVNNEILKNIDVVNENNNTSFVFNGETPLHISVTEDSQYITITIKAARDVYDKIIVIDAGHGGTDPGTQGYLNGVTYLEKTVALDMAKKTVENISKDSRFKVYETRSFDYDTPKTLRADFSSEVEADMFISIHANAATSNSIPNGIEVFYYDVSTANSAYLVSQGITDIEYRKEITAESKDFAAVMQKNLIDATQLKDRSYKHGDYLVLRQNDAPSILIETGFMTNPQDMVKLADENYRALVAQVIADTVIGYYDYY